MATLQELQQKKQQLIQQQSSAEHRLIELVQRENTMKENTFDRVEIASLEYEIIALEQSIGYLPA